MELKPGYKQTEVGIIPEDWEVESLGSRASFRTGPFGSTLHKSDYVSNGIPVINPMHIINGEVKPTSAMTISGSAATKLSEFRLKAGDIVIGRRGDMGRCAVVQPENTGWLCGTGSMIIRCGPTADAGYVQRVLSSPRAISAIEETSVGSTMINLNQTTLAGVIIQFPPLPEQLAIAKILSDVDALIASLERLIAKKRDIKQATMQQLLTGKKRLPGFEGEWDVVDFGDIATIRNEKIIAGLTVIGTQCIEMDCIGPGNGRLINSVNASGSASKYRFKRGDVLFGRLRAYLRKYWFASFDGLCSTEIWPLIPCNNRVCAEFLYLIVQTNEFANLAEVSYGTHMPRSDWDVLRKLRVKLPKTTEQLAIAKVLSDMDTEIKLLEKRLEKTRAIKQGMMQELLTGKTRLITSESAKE